MGAGVEISLFPKETTHTPELLAVFYTNTEIANQNWQHVIEKAPSKDMDGEKVERLMDLV